ncbi:MAG: TPM domain-containing protein [Saprospiraceae bacterium]|nr:TPM domain-containing protein [Saprospiraceae bacterium]
MIKFFNKEQEDQIIRAIQEAEKNTSGEIRVHIEADAEGDIVELSTIIFQKLGMHKTALRNGVLIVLAPERKEFAIIGDKGINEKVSEHFWEDERDLMQAHFKGGQFAEGISLAIQQIGAKLKQFFPYEQGDENELPDDISYN